MKTKPNTKLLLEREVRWLDHLRTQLQNALQFGGTLENKLKRQFLRDAIATAEAEVERLKEEV